MKSILLIGLGRFGLDRRKFQRVQRRSYVAARSQCIGKYLKLTILYYIIQLLEFKAESGVRLI